MSEARRLQLADDVLRRLAAALRAVRLYAPNHPLVARNIAAVVEALGRLHALAPTVDVSFVGDEIVIGDLPVPNGEAALGGALTRLRDRGIERISIDRDAQADELERLVHLLAEAAGGRLDGSTVAADEWFLRAEAQLPHVRIGALRLQERVQGSSTDAVAIRQVYNEAVTAAATLWRGAEAEFAADPDVARALVNGLAQSVAQNHRLLLALTALREYDTYTFTHMVNVSILSMAQARTLGIDGPMLREIGMAALMHDIGKVRTPDAILNKPEKLTDEELVIMRRHPVDGASILRRTPNIPPLAPLVAFEHHLRLDGSGYPSGLARSTLNLGTQLCAIADVYDAMRSQRAYQQAFPTDRILQVLNTAEHSLFDRHLVRRFIQLLGIYPPGSLVQLNTDDVAVVLAAHATDPYRPRVRILFRADRSPVDLPHPVDLWTTDPGSPGPSGVVKPVDPADWHVDPLSYL